MIRVVSGALALAAVLAIAAPRAWAGRPRCEVRCGERITECVLARGGTDGAEIAPCRREAVGACRRRGARACPLPSRATLADTLATVSAVEAAVHTTPLCVALLPDVPAATVEAAIAVGRDTAATLAATNDPGFGARGSGHRGGAFAKLFIQGTFGHGARSFRSATWCAPWHARRAR